MPFVPGVVCRLVVRWAVVALIASPWTGCASVAGAAQAAEGPARPSPWPCRLIPASKIRPVVERGMARSETMRRQCEELASARAVVVLEWGVMDSQSHAITGMAVRDGVVVAVVKLPPLGDVLALIAHELQHVIEQTRELDYAVEAKRAGSGVWLAFGGYETQAAVDVGHQVTRELRAHNRASRK